MQVTWLRPASQRAAIRLAVQAAVGRLAQAAPSLLVALVLLVSARVFYIARAYSSLLGFAELGRTFARHIGLQGAALSTYGFDGQFAYYLALRPQLVLTCAHDAPSCPLDTPTVRSQRILYPMLARLLAFNQPAAIPFTLLLINFVAVLVVTTLVGQMCAASGASRWWGVAAGLFTGEILGFVRDLTDPLSVMWAVVALWLVRKNRPLWAAGAACAALLTREDMILFVPLLALPLVAQRRWATLCWSALVGGLPFLGWEVFLRLTYGRWTLIPGRATASLDLVPFSGLWQDRSLPEFAAVILTAAVPLTLGIVVGVVCLRRGRIRDVLANPVPLMAVGYCTLCVFLSPVQWLDVWGPARLAAPGVVFGVVAVCTLNRPLRVAYSLTLLPIAALLVFVFLAQLLAAGPG